MLQKQALRTTHDVLSRELPNDRPVRVLEAGGGSTTHIRLDRPAHIVALDISPEQLERNDYADAKILGDLQDPNAITGLYDLIVCFDVLEHLTEPEKAIENMAAALDEGGLLVIGCPNRWSLKGLLTRFTPHGFHVWYYRTLRGDRHAGEPGHAPFPTYLRSGMGFGRLLDAARRFGLKQAFATTYEGPAVEELRKRHPFVHVLHAVPAEAGRILSGGRWLAGETDYIAVLRREGAPAERPVRLETASTVQH